MTSEQNWLSWVKLGSSDLNFEMGSNQLQAIGWALAMVLFGFLVLAFDTRTPTQNLPSGFNLRDRIAGLEQRYFLVVLNGFLLYGALTIFLQTA